MNQPEGLPLRLHAWERSSRANGPGWRAVIWVQGCTLGCAGCFNPGSHDPDAGMVWNTAELAKEVLDLRGQISGISFSGGEPFQQPEAVLDWLIRLDASGLSRLAFSGYTLDEIRRQPLGRSILGHLDVLVAGRYVAARHEGRGLIGSGNQHIHLLTKRHDLAEFARVPGAELILHADGSITRTGIAPVPP